MFGECFMGNFQVSAVPKSDGCFFSESDNPEFIIVQKTPILGPPPSFWKWSRTKLHTGNCKRTLYLQPTMLHNERKKQVWIHVDYIAILV